MFYGREGGVGAGGADVGVCARGSSVFISEFSVVLSIISKSSAEILIFSSEGRVSREFVIISLFVVFVSVVSISSSNESFCSVAAETGSSFVVLMSSVPQALKNKKLAKTTVYFFILGKK